MSASLPFLVDRFWQATRVLATSSGSIGVRLDQAAGKLQPVLPEDLPVGDLREKYEHLRERLVNAAAPRLPERQAAAIAESVCDLCEELTERASDW